MENAIVEAIKKGEEVEGTGYTPTKQRHMLPGDEQEERNNPNTLEAAKTLSKVASLKSRSIDKGRRYKRRKESTSKKVVSSLDFQEQNAGRQYYLLTAVIIKDKEKGKLICAVKKLQRKNKETDAYLQEEASLARTIRLIPYKEKELRQFI
ncbi:hypothetical protein Tco_0925570 [Tanacetum coccineum]|uniref:Uncharacterized protein n=1 Tax=Tanacetum coccineum TaxID=301880 RepID=A0ABQ5D785_9ASTR